MIVAIRSDEVTPVIFDEIIPMYDFMMAHKTEPLIGKYWIWNYPNSPWGRKCALITKDWIERDIRFFQLDFIIHHNLHVGIQQ